MANIGSASCVSDDEVYEETRKVLEGCDLEEGLQQFILQHETGAERPPEVVWEPLPNSGSQGMGHMGQGREAAGRRPGEWDTYSLGRPEAGQQTLAESGRSRSDLGWPLSQSQASLHRRPAPQDATSLPPVRPKKPPRLMQYTGGQQQQQQQQQQQPQQQQPQQPKESKPRPPRSVSITSVENTEYYALPDQQLASSDYNSDQSTDYSPGSSPHALRSPLPTSSSIPPRPPFPHCPLSVSHILTSTTFSLLTMFTNQPFLPVLRARMDTRRA